MIQTDRYYYTYYLLFSCLARKEISRLIIATTRSLYRLYGWRLILVGEAQTHTIIMGLGDGCRPNIDWSLCEDSTGFPQVLPAFYVLSAIFFGMTGMLYAWSMVKTLQAQFRDKRRLSYNTAMQMHAWIVAFCIAAVCHDAVRTMIGEGSGVELGRVVCR